MPKSVLCLYLLLCMHKLCKWLVEVWVKLPRVLQSLCDLQHFCHNLPVLRCRLLLVWFNLLPMRHRMLGMLRVRFILLGMRGWILPFRIELFAVQSELPDLLRKLNYLHRLQ